MSAISGAPRARRLLKLAVMVAVTGLSLAACSSKSSGTPSGSNNSGSTTTSNSGSTGTSTSTTASAGSSAISKLVALTHSVQSAKGGTFKLSYTETSSTSSSTEPFQSFTFEQMPPKYVFGINGTTKASIIDNGSGTYECSDEAGQSVCLSFGTSNPFGALLGVITGQTVVTEFNSLKSGLASKLAGVSATFSNQTIAGQSVQCVSGVKAGNTFKYCLTNSGVLAYAGGSTATGGGAITLTSYSTSVSASDFALPPGAKIEKT